MLLSLLIIFELELSFESEFNAEEPDFELFKLLILLLFVLLMILVLKVLLCPERKDS